MEDIKETALRASYFIVGVKDQQFVNLMVAESLLSKKDLYIQDRDKIKDKEITSILDKHHGIN